MKKICVLLSALLSVSFFTYAQVDTRPFIFSVVPQISIPTGDFKKTNKLGFGGNFTGQITLTEKLKGLVTLGGSQYRGKEYESGPGYPSDYPTVSALYLRGGLKIFVTEAIFLAGNIGAAKINQPENEIGLTWAPQLGCELGGVDLYLKYDVVEVKTFNGSKLQALGICIGYRF